MKRWLLAGFLLAGCGGPDANTVTVFAASSLTSPFTQIADIYEQQHPGTTVAVTFGGSADLVAQLEQGAPASALATADEATMAKADWTSPQPFATNAMTIVIPEGNPGAVRGIADLSNPDLTVVICAPQVPCGAATAAIEQSAGIDIAADSEESAVADVLGKVSSGQADAGIVYQSDLGSAGVTGIAIPDSVNAINTYMIAARDTRGREFLDTVLSEQGQQVLADNGFGPP